MKKNIKRMWINALRSGKYKQTIGSLRNEPDDGVYTYCCLGVLTELYAKKKKFRWERLGSDYLPKVVMKWAGLKNMDPELTPDNTCSEANDNMEYSFKRIATLIEKNL